MQDLDSSMEFLLFPSPKEKKGVFLKLELRAGVLEVRSVVSGNEAEAGIGSWQEQSRSVKTEFRQPCVVCLILS